MTAKVHVCILMKARKKTLRFIFNCIPLNKLILLFVSSLEIILIMAKSS